MSNEKEIVLTPNQHFQVLLTTEIWKISGIISRSVQSGVTPLKKQRIVSTFISTLPNGEAYQGELKSIFDRCIKGNVLQKSNPFIIGMSISLKPKNKPPIFESIQNVWAVVVNYCAVTYLKDTGFVKPLDGHQQIEKLE